MPNISSFHHYPHWHMSFHMHKTASTLAKHAGIFVWMGCSEPVIISPKNMLEFLLDGLFETNPYPQVKIKRIRDQWKHGFMWLDCSKPTSIPR